MHTPKPLYRRMCRRLRLALWLMAGTALLSQGLWAQQLDSVFPPQQRVHDMITLKGTGFGTFSPGISAVLFSDGVTTVQAGTPYVWRNDFIQVRVPVGDLIGATPTPIPAGLLSVTVATAAGVSNAQSFQVIKAVGTPAFTEMTDVQPVVGGLEDLALFLGDPDNGNDMRSKDAEPADVNADGLPDLIDNNSNNVGNNHNPIVHLNTGAGDFTALVLEPRDAADTQPTLTTIPPGGDFIGNTVLYDADFLDLNNDGWLDGVQAASRVGTNRLRILINGAGGLVARFTEASAAWVPGNSFNGCPDDIGHWDVNNDGFVDVGAAMRTVFFGACQAFGNSTGEARVWTNNGTSLNAALVFPSPPGSSAHDIFFLDADDDGWADFINLNENANSELFRNNGSGTNFIATVPTFTNALAGAAGDFNGDGLPDFVLVGFGLAQVFINNPASPGTFLAPVNLPGVAGLPYDVELGDLDLDGSLDIAIANITTNPGDTARIWLNNGAGSFTNFTSPDATAVLPNVAAIQRLSADFLDFDWDGDLDLYLTGADGQNASPGGGFGRAPNQFWRNDLDPALPALPQTDAWMRDTVNDNGTVPSPGNVMWQSPDIWNRHAPDCAPTPGQGNCNTNNHQNPEFGQTNYFYGKIRNRGAEIMHKGRVEFWIASASVGLAWPADFNKIGEIPVLSLLPGEVRNIGPLLWDPPNPAPSDHFCVYVRIITDQDPLLPPETSSVFHNTKHENGIVWRNLKIEDNMSGSSSFIVRNLEPSEDTIDLRLETVQALLNVADVFLFVDDDGPNPFQRWNGDGTGFEQIDDLTFVITAPDAVLENIPLLGSEEFGMRLETQAPAGAVNTPRELVFTQIQGGETVGGINLRVGVKKKPCRKAVPIINEIELGAQAIAVQAQNVQFIEIQAVGCIGVDLAAFQLQLSEFEAARESVYRTLDLPDVTLAPDRLFVICSKKSSIKECDMVVEGDFLRGEKEAAISVKLGDETVDRRVYNDGVMRDDFKEAFSSLSRYPDGVDMTGSSFSQRCASPGKANYAESSQCRNPASNGKNQ